MVPIVADQMDKADSRLDEPSRDQALRAELGSRFVVEAVEAARGFAFTGKVGISKRFDLHARGEFEVLDAGIELRKIAAHLLMPTIKRLHELQVSALLGSARALRAFEIEDRIAS